MWNVPGIILTMVIAIEAATTHPEEFGLQEREAQILGQELDCGMLDECEESSGKICASNGESYKSLCAFMRAHCEEREIEFLHHEECTASEKCLGQRKFALKKAKTQSGNFIPTCNKEDGTFTTVQCHKDSKYCWCSTPAGLGLPGTHIYEKIPKCDNHTGTSTSGHSPKRTEGGRSKGGCVGRKRKLFNSKMMQKMVTDFTRIHERTFSSGTELQAAAVKWKFNLLDTKKDGELRKKEYKGIQKLVRGNMEPKKCARKFPKFCDENNDQKITLEEWMKCFSADDTLTDVFAGRKVPNNSGKHGKTILQLGNGSIGKRRQNCERDRKQAKENYDNGNKDIYVPRCDDDGRYWPVQCYGSTKQWYCFCVNVLTGDMMPNTSVQNVSPVCTTGIIPNPWPKCPPPDKEKKFLKSLMTFFTNYAKHNVSRKYESKSNSKGDKKILEKIFKYLDKNNNGELEGRERKNLKNILKSGKNLWLCGKKIHKVCDIDLDNRISLQELFTCVLPRKIQLNQNSVVQSKSPGGNVGNRKGPNPFEEILKPEQKK